MLACFKGESLAILANFFTVTSHLRFFHRFRFSYSGADYFNKKTGNTRHSLLAESERCVTGVHLSCSRAIPFTCHSGQTTRTIRISYSIAYTFPIHSAVKWAHSFLKAPDSWPPSGFVPRRKELLFLRCQRAEWLHRLQACVCQPDI